MIDNQVSQSIQMPLLIIGYLSSASTDPHAGQVDKKPYSQTNFTKERKGSD